MLLDSRLTLFCCTTVSSCCDADHCDVAVFVTVARTLLTFTMTDCSDESAVIVELKS